MANNYYDLGTSKNASDDDAHPVDAYLFWNTPKDARNAAAALMDKVMDNMTDQHERFEALTGLLDFVAVAAANNESYFNT